MIKFHVVKEAIQRSSSLPFITDFNLFFFNVNAKTSTGYSTYFTDVIQYYYILSIQSGVSLIEVSNGRN